MQLCLFVQGASQIVAAGAVAPANSPIAARANAAGVIPFGLVGKVHLTC